MNSGIKLSVATNFTDGLLDAVQGYPVAELFGKLASDAVGGGRASFMFPDTSRSAFARHVRTAKARGIGFNYLLNPACLDNLEYTKKWQRELDGLLDFVEDCGIEGVTVSLPILLETVKRRRPRLKVRVGVYARVDNAAKARSWEDMGADSITLESISVNRDFKALAAVRKAVKVELQLLANSNCLMHCPLSGQHMVELSHASQKGHKSGGFMVDYCALKCSYEKLKERVNYIRSEFIRPEDIGTYTDMGFTSFKILERGAPTNVMAARVKAYSEGHWDGNLLDLIQPYGYKEKKDAEHAFRFWRFFLRPGTARLGKLMGLKKLADKRGLTAPLPGDPVYIDNRALGGFLEGFRDRDCRASSCAECGWCAGFAKKAVRVDEGYRDEMLKLYFESFGDILSGSLWRNA